MVDPSVKSSFADNNATFADFQALDGGNMFKDRLLQEMLKKGWKPADLARESNVPAKRISDYLKGPKVASADYLFPLAAALSVSAEWLALGYETKRQSHLVDASNADWIEVPLYDLRQLTDDGKGEIIEAVPFRRDWLNTAVGLSSGLWLARLPSDYVAEDLREGDLVLLQDVKPGQYVDRALYILRIDGGMTIARLSMLSDPGLFAAGDRLGEVTISLRQIGMEDGYAIPVARIMGVPFKRI